MSCSNKTALSCSNKTAVSGSEKTAVSGSNETAVSGSEKTALSCSAFSRLNSISADAARELFLGCCHCERWATEMTNLRPFESEQSLYEAAEKSWAGSSELERLEAFLGHPQIGDMEALRNKYAASATREQGQISAADEQTLIDLADLNRRYLAQHGFIFIVCATGKSAQEMLLLLKDRIGNTRQQELDNAAREQGAITRLRLGNLLAS